MKKNVASVEAISIASDPTDASSPDKLHELEKIVLEHQRQGLEAARALYDIKEGKHYKTVKGNATRMTWGDYCRMRFGFTQQYASRLIAAWKCHENQQHRFGEQRSEVFKHFPNTIHFWAQIARLGDNAGNDLLENLLNDEGKLQEDWSKRVADAQGGRRKEKDGGISGNKDVTEAVHKALATIKNSNVWEVLTKLTQQERNLFSRELKKLVAEASVNEVNPEAEN